MKKMKFLTALVTLLLTISNSYSWDGYKISNNDNIEFDENISEGDSTDMYNWTKGRYENVDIESVDSTFGEVEVYNWDTGGYETLDMD